MLNRNEALTLLREAGAILDGHFLLTSGRHSGVYVEKFRLLEKPQLTAQFAEPIAEHFREASPEIIIGPLTGGVLLAHEVAKLLGTPIAFPERFHDQFEWRRGFKLHEGQRVLIVEDVITTGRTMNEVMDAVRRTGAEVIGIGCMVCRGKIRLEPYPFSVVSINLGTYTEDRCPLCRKGLPLEKRGSRAIAPKSAAPVEEKPRREPKPKPPVEAPLPEEPEAESAGNTSADETPPTES
ncbi:orotate phosphoribosyltransferase [bacterium]|nr:orotate phosphoribosyltransferase [bacterium]MBU1983127.1 orotate phosphoribosyltransferase [bacterium]